jgi:hypothetical protein
MKNFLPCERCGGKLFAESDRYGQFTTCISCGLTRDIEMPPKPFEQIDWTVIKNQWQKNRA